jgi:hypothetical protein
MVRVRMMTNTAEQTVPRSVSTPTLLPSSCLHFQAPFSGFIFDLDHGPVDSILATPFAGRNQLQSSRERFEFWPSDIAQLQVRMANLCTSIRCGETQDSDIKSLKHAFDDAHHGGQRALI